MRIASYKQGVRRFGSERPFVNENGDRFNLKHDTRFLPDDVKTDGRGNVIDMPLLKDKPCFGRPERFIRGAEEDAIPPFTGRNKTADWQLTRCQRCPIVDACVRVVIERVQSSPTAARNFVAWDEETAWLTGREKFKGSPGRLWSKFLSAIEAHGGWTNVNDKNVVEARHEHKLQRLATNRRSKQNARATLKAARRGATQPLTATFLDAVERERQRRVDVLLDLSRKPYARIHLPRVSKLNSQGCHRTADVWAAHVVLVRAKGKATGKMIAELLKSQGRDHGLPTSTLETRVYKDLDRIYMLEHEHAGVTVWEAFDEHA